jgi:hypothetical protein
VVERTVVIDRTVVGSDIVVGSPSSGVPEASAAADKAPVRKSPIESKNGFVRPTGRVYPG